MENYDELDPPPSYESHLAPSGGNGHSREEEEESVNEVSLCCDGQIVRFDLSR